MVKTKEKAFGGSGIFTDEELKYLFEQIGKLAFTCPKDWLRID